MAVPHDPTCRARWGPWATCSCGAVARAADRTQLTLAERVRSTAPLPPAGDRTLPPVTGTTRLRDPWWVRALRSIGLAVAVILSVPRYSSADRWSAGDTFVEAGVALTLGADYLQTRQICAHAAADHAAGGNDWRVESNPIMGPECDRVPAEVYFPVALAAHVVVARLLPRPLRRAWQFVTIAVQVDSIDRNARAGFSIRW